MTQDIIKNIPLTLDINARKRLDETVDISLYSKDIATGQFEFTFIDEDGKLVALDETYSAQALVKYEGNSKTYLDDMVIEGNIIRFIFPHGFIIKDGTVKMYIYVTKDNYTSDVAAISFPVFVSEIDKDLDTNISVHYIGKIEKLIDDMKAEIKTYQVDVDELIAGYENSVARLVAIEDGYKPQLQSLTTQMAQKVGQGTKAEPEDLSDRTLQLVTGGGTVNVLSEPQNYSVNPKKTTFLDFTEEEINFFDPSNVIEGGFLRASDGTLTATTTWVSTDFIDIIESDKIKVATSAGGTYNVTFWNSAEDFVSGQSQVFSTTEREERIFTTPANANFFKVGVRTTEFDTFFVSINEQKKYTSVALKDYVDLSKALEKESMNELISDNSLTPEKTTYLGIKNTRRINQFDKTAITSGGYYNNTGTFASSSTVSSSGFIPTKSNDIIRVKVLTQGNNHITFWDADDNFVSGEVRILYPGEVSTFTTPSNPAITKFKVAVRVNEINSYMITVNQSFPDRYWNYDDMDYEIYLKDKMARAVQSEVQSEVEKNKKTALEGLKWGIVGDSISTVGYKGGEYPQKISGKNNMPTQNLAVPGSLVAKSSKSGHATTHMCQKVLELDLDCDLVTVAGGTNDERLKLPIGTFEDMNIETFYGAMHELCKNLIARFPETPKAVFTPIKMRGRNTNLKKYVDVIKEVCAYYAIPVCDNFNEADLQPDIDTINNVYFSNADGVHPNTLGHMMLARKVENFLLGLV